MRLSRPAPLQFAMIAIVAVYAGAHAYLRIQRDHIRPMRITALFEAIRDDRRDEVERITRTDASLVNVYEPREASLQPFSPYRGEESTNLYATPLGFAIRRSNARIARLLVERGASLESRNYNVSDQQPSDPEDHDLQLHCVSLGDDWDRQVSPLHLAVIANNRPLVELFLEKGVDVNTADRESRGSLGGHYHPVGGTALHCAAEMGLPDMASLLIARGADVSDRDQMGRTPLDLALENHHPDVAWVLVAAGGLPGAPQN